MSNQTKRAGFKNIQIQSKIELAEQFEDAFQQSGANSKAEFLGILLDEWLNPDVTSSKKATEAINEKNELFEKLQSANDLNNENEEKIALLTESLNHYENETLMSLLAKHQGKKLRFTSPVGKEIELVINDVKDVYTAVINSIKV